MELELLEIGVELEMLEIVVEIELEIDVAYLTILSCFLQLPEGERGSVSTAGSRIIFDDLITLRG